MKNIMSSNLLLIRGCLLVSQVLLFSVSNSYSRSLGIDVQNLNTTSRKPAEEVVPLPLVHKQREFVNFVDGECPPTKNTKLNNIHNCENLCTADEDCRDDNKCCQIGCGFTCVEPWFQKQVVDWDNSPSTNEIYGNEILEEKLNGRVEGEPCSTSILDGMEPLKCPTHYVCLITTDGDIQLNIPNRGECVTKNHQEISKTSRKSKIMYELQNTECLYRGKTYKHEEKFRKDCNMCVCYNKVVFCGIKTCPVKIGIPAAAPISKPEHINNDNVPTLEEEEEEVEGGEREGEGEGEEGEGEEEEDDSGSTQNEFDDEDSGSTQEERREGSNTKKPFKESQSLSTKMIVQFTASPRSSQRTEAGIYTSSNTDDFQTSIFVSTRQKPRSNRTILQGNIKINNPNLKFIDVSTQTAENIRNETSSDDNSFESITILRGTEHVVNKKPSSSTIEVKLKKESFEEIDSVEDLEKTVSGSGYERNDTSSSGGNIFEQSGSGDRQIQNTATEGSLSKIGESSMKDTVFLRKLDTEGSCGGDNGSGLMEEKADVENTGDTDTNLEDGKPRSEILSRDERWPPNYRSESLEYMATTDDEN